MCVYFVSAQFLSRISTMDCQIFVQVFDNLLSFWKKKHFHEEYFQSKNLEF